MSIKTARIRYVTKEQQQQSPLEDVHVERHHGFCTHTHTTWVLQDLGYGMDNYNPHHATDWFVIGHKTHPASMALSQVYAEVGHLCVYMCYMLKSVYSISNRILEVTQACIIICLKPLSRKTETYNLFNFLDRPSIYLQQTIACAH